MPAAPLVPAAYGYSLSERMPPLAWTCAGSGCTDAQRIAPNCAELRGGGAHPSEGLLDRAALAAVLRRALVAVDQLLLRERGRDAAVDEQRGLDRAGRRERPARTARALVLDRRHRARRSPVDRRRQRAVRARCVAARAAELDGGDEAVAARGERREVLVGVGVVAELERGVLAVVLLHKGVVHGKIAPGGDLFRGCEIDLVVHMAPGRKLVVGRRCGRRDGGENGAAEEGKRHRRSPA